MIFPLPRPPPDIGKCVHPPSPVYSHVYLLITDCVMAILMKKEKIFVAVDGGGFPELFPELYLRTCFNWNSF